MRPASRHFGSERGGVLPTNCSIAALRKMRIAGPAWIHEPNRKGRGHPCPRDAGREGAENLGTGMSAPLQSAAANGDGASLTFGNRVLPSMPLDAPPSVKRARAMNSD